MRRRVARQTIRWTARLHMSRTTRWCPAVVHRRRTAAARQSHAGCAVTAAATITATVGMGGTADAPAMEHVRANAAVVHERHRRRDDEAKVGFEDDKEFNDGGATTK